MTEIAYLHHSGFQVSTPEHRLIFDYLGEGLPEPSKGERAIAFVSHRHADHFWPGVLDWHGRGLCGLCVGKGVRAGVPAMKPGEEALVDGARVRAFGSTDEGVSFWVESGGLKVFHAGDYNFWHWRGESTPEEVRDAQRQFEKILDSMSGHPVDIAMFPVDPRMGEGFDEGALRFAEAVRPRLLLPMHFWDRPGCAADFADKAMPAGVRARALLNDGEKLSFEEAVL